MTLRGFRLDGQDRLNDLVSLHGSCSGLTLEDIQFYGFRHNGVVLHGCNGSPEQPVLLRRLCIAPSHPANSAIFLNADHEEANRHIRILDCRLEGLYPDAVRIHGSAQDLELTRNRE